MEVLEENNEIFAALVAFLAIGGGLCGAGSARPRPMPVSVMTG
ncbi:MULTISPECIES: hypothetical protein [unclassified Streptomyces]